MTIETIFNQFAGQWAFTREMLDASGNQIAHASGQAFFKQNNAGLGFHEEGKAFYRPVSQPTPFFRDYLYCLEQQMITVYHANGPQVGQLYQQYTLDATGTKLQNVVKHLCGDDVYEGFYAWSGETRFSLMTTISGNSKQLVIKTNFERILG